MDDEEDLELSQRDLELLDAIATSPQPATAGAEVSSKRGRGKKERDKGRGRGKGRQKAPNGDAASDKPRSVAKYCGNYNFWEKSHRTSHSLKNATK